jgi:4-alpha-glucanotransferase
VGLPDVVGDRRAQNQPGTDQEYPNWRVPLTDGSGKAVLLDALVAGEARDGAPPSLLERITAPLR